jgi:hypothetical protein
VDAPTAAVQNVRRADGQLGGQAFTLLVKKSDENVILEPLHDGHEALAQVKDPRLLLSIDGHNCRSSVSPLTILVEVSSGFFVFSVPESVQGCKENFFNFLVWLGLEVNTMK